MLPYVDGWRVGGLGGRQVSRLLNTARAHCRVDTCGRLGLLFRRRVGPLLLVAGGREQCLLALYPNWRLCRVDPHGHLYEPPLSLCVLPLYPA